MGVIKKPTYERFNKNTNYMIAEVSCLCVFLFGWVVVIWSRDKLVEGERRDMNASKDGRLGSEFLISEVLSGEEITVFPESAAVLDIENKNVTVTVANELLSESDGMTFYGDRDVDGPRSLLFATWRKTEAVCYFAVLVVVFVILAFLVYFAFVMLMIRRSSSRSSGSGVRWTRLRQH